MDELLNILAETEGGDGEEAGYATTKEICSRTGWGRDKVLQRLNELAEEGKIAVKRVVRTNIAGGVNKVPAYKLLK